MPTLRSLASTTSGLYRDMQSGRSYQHHELLAFCSPATLSRYVRMEKRAPGGYLLHLDNGDTQLFEFSSRRRLHRALESAA